MNSFSFRLIYCIWFIYFVRLFFSSPFRVFIFFAIGLANSTSICCLVLYFVLECVCVCASIERHNRHICVLCEYVRALNWCLGLGTSHRSRNKNSIAKAKTMDVIHTLTNAVRARATAQQIMKALRAHSRTSLPLDYWIRDEIESPHEPNQLRAKQKHMKNQIRKEKKKKTKFKRDRIVQMLHK